MTVNAITDTEKGRTGIAPTYLHVPQQCELRTPCGTLRTARGTRVTSRPISGRVRMLVRILPVRQFAVRKLPNPNKNIWITETYTNAVAESITTSDVWSLNAVVRKHPNVSAANTVNVNANIVLALAKKVFIVTFSSIVTM